MCEIFVAVPLTNECCARRKIAAEQLASASGCEALLSCYGKSHSESGILLAEEEVMRSKRISLFRRFAR